MPVIFVLQMRTLETLEIFPEDHKPINISPGS